MESIPSFAFAPLAWIPLLPLLGAIFNGIFGRSLPKKAVAGIAIGAMVAAFAVAVTSFVTMMSHGVAEHGHMVYPQLTHHYFTWFSVGSLHIDFALLLDPLSAVMALIITGVGTLIHIYSMGYMSDEPSYSRYFTYLNFFVFAMLMLVLGDSMPLLFMGWEGVGVASYLLIGFWYEDEAKAAAGKKAFITNRVGDFAVLIAMFLLFNMAGTLDFVEIRDWASHLSATQVAAIGGGISAACILLFIGCTGKSAQIPLYVWLPDAMAGPTPVSALIHAATMVTAGIYLIARLNFLFVLSPVAMTIVATIGGLTAFFAATIGITQNDIKKVLAYSTVSQLGYMFLAVGVGSFFGGVFHLMTHAFFKALLFLGSGSVIHGMHHEQDIRKMGGLKKYMPITQKTFLIGCLAISGIVPFAGFFSKDEVLWYTLSNEHVLGSVIPGWNYVLWGLGVATAGMTAFYMFRLYYLTFEGECRADEDTKAHIHESPFSMTMPLVVLAGLAAFSGFLGLPHVFHLPNVLHNWLHQVIAPGEAMYQTTMGDGVAWAAMGISLAVAIVSILAARARYSNVDNLPAGDDVELVGLQKVVANKYYVDELYEATLGRGIRLKGTILHRVVDEVLIDLVLVNGAAAVANFAGLVLRQFQNGNLQRYVVYVVLGLGAIIYFF